MSALKKVVDGIKLVAPVAADIIVPGSGRLIESLMRKVTGDSDSEIEAVAQQIIADPALMVDLQKAALEQEVKLADIEAKKLETVNTTIREESKSEKWPQYSWRPWNGFIYPLAVILIYFVLPLTKASVPDVPQWIWVGWLAILGVATYGRNKEKIAKAGGGDVGVIASTINAIRGGNG